MSYTILDKFAKFKVEPETELSVKVWDSKELYKTNYFLLSSKNPLALNQSTVQLLKERSANLKSISTNKSFIDKPIDNKDFIVYDKDNLYRSSYHEMTDKKPVLLRNYFLPKYTGFIPGMKSEHPIGENTTQLALKQIKKFDDNRLERKANNKLHDWQYNPMSRILGNFYKNKSFVNVLSKSFDNHTHSTLLRDSGYSKNLLSSKQNSAWLNKTLNGDMIRSEYRIHYNRKKDFHYKHPMFNKGILKPKETNYKHN